MKASSFLPLCEKLESLAQRLPEALRQPILGEITPVKRLFVLQRAPRLVILGERAAHKAQLLNALFGSEVLPPPEEDLHDGAWLPLRIDGRGSLEVLDARRPVSLPAAQAALATRSADLILVLRGAEQIDGEFAADLDHAARLMDAIRENPALRVLGLQCSGDDAAREQLHGALHTVPAIEQRMIGTLSWGAGSEETARLVEVLGGELPPESQLELARLSGNRVLQAQIARVLLKSTTAIAGAIGAQPIPMADFPVLTALQGALVAGIMHISARPMSPRLAGEFIGALGANLGFALALREGARAGVKLLPVWGNAISGAVAAAGTYGVGRAAIAFFIEGVSLEEARKFFTLRRKFPFLRG